MFRMQRLQFILSCALILSVQSVQLENTNSKNDLNQKNPEGRFLGLDLGGIGNPLGDILSLLRTPGRSGLEIKLLELFRRLVHKSILKIYIDSKMASGFDDIGTDGSLESQGVSTRRSGLLGLYPGLGLSGFGGLGGIGGLGGFSPLGGLGLGGLGGGCGILGGLGGCHGGLGLGSSLGLGAGGLGLGLGTGGLGLGLGAGGLGLGLGGLQSGFASHGHHDHSFSQEFESGRDNHGSYSSYSPTKYSHEHHESYASPSVDTYGPPSDTYGVPSDTYGAPYAPPSDTYSPPAAKVVTQKYYS